MTEPMTVLNGLIEATQADEKADEKVGEQSVPLHSVPDSTEPIPTELTLEPSSGSVVTDATAGRSSEDSLTTGVTVGESVDEREQARAVWRESAALGQPLTGRELGERFGRSERWGRDRIAEVRQAGTNGTGDAAGATVPARRRRARAGKPSAGAGTLPARQATTERGDEPHAVAVETRSQAVQAQSSAADVLPAPAERGVPAGVPVSAGARLVAWAGFLFGTVISVAANVLYAWLPTLAREAPAPGLAPQVGAAVWPIALVISVEVLSRVPWGPGWAWRLARYGGAGVVAAGAAVISYGHLNGVLAAWGYGTTGAAVGPLVVDGLMTISGFALLAMSNHGNGTDGGKEVSR